MEYEKIKQLMKDMENSRLSSMDVEFPDGTKVRMEKKEEVKIVQQEYKNDIKPEKKEKENNNDNENENEKRNIVKSPMIGTFYSKPSPTSKSFVQIGSTVQKGNVLCIIEAMKLMNEIESEYEGKIVEIYVKDGETVDYGKPLFKIV